MRLGDPIFLLLLLAVPVMALLAYRAHRARRVRLARFVSDELSVRLTPSVSRGRRLTKDALLLVALTLLAVGAARPQWGYRWERVDRRGIELVVVLDTSASMRARDALPSRLDRAKLELGRLLELLEDDQVALVAFAGLPFVQCPMTVDYRTAELFLREVSTELLPKPGTAIGAGVRQALSLFSTGGTEGRAILLITDGEDHGSDPLGAAELAKQLGVAIFAIGVGGDSPVTIPLGEGESAKKDADGKLVLSSLDEATLIEMANLTGGAYVRSTTGALNVDDLLAEIRRSTTPKSVVGSRTQRWEDRYQALVFVALVLLVVEALLDERRRGRGRWTLRRWRGTGGTEVET